MHDGDTVKNNFGLTWQEVINRNVGILRERYSVNYIEKLKDKDKQLYDTIIVQNEYRLTAEEIKDRIIVDIGANIGFFTAACLQHSPKHIYAAEPVPSTFAKLKKLYNNEIELHFLIMRYWIFPTKLFTLVTPERGLMLLTQKMKIKLHPLPWDKLSKMLMITT